MRTELDEPAADSSALTKSYSLWFASGIGEENVTTDRSPPCALGSSLLIKMQKAIRLNDGHVTYLGLLAKKDGTRRGCLSKRSSDNTKWHSKWFALLQNMLFYFENESSSRPSGLYLLEGCICDRAPSPKPSLSARECLEKQVCTHGHALFFINGWNTEMKQNCFSTNVPLELSQTQSLIFPHTSEKTWPQTVTAWQNITWVI